ncbi:MAG: hypothetical protein PHG04_01955 [Candidatus Nanoarchaeia archaeon]|nr:hypothetical protein [Candidatus Nanoarchaeia archaeon]
MKLEKLIKKDAEKIYHTPKQAISTNEGDEPFLIKSFGKTRKEYTIWNPIPLSDSEKSLKSYFI